MRFHIALVGFGNVARRFARLLDESRDALQALDIDPVIVGIATRRHGAVFNAAGLGTSALNECLRLADAGHAVGPAFSEPAAGELIRQLGKLDSEARVMIETTTLNVQSGEPAISHVRAAFAAGAHVITANKGPVALAYRALADEAARRGLSFLFEGAVMDGIPVFNLVRETMPATTIHGFRGVINSTTNHILCALERGEDYNAALKRMQDEGIAEADPSLDVDGWDAAAKVAAMANVWLDANITPRDVVREGLTPQCQSRAVAARTSGRRLKLVGAASRRGTTLAATVGLEELPGDDPLATLDDQANAIEIHSTPLGRIVITQRDGGMEKTAYALLTDLVTMRRRL
ncbi:MAG: homoserine dehydrogenase [Acidobacteria bacterium]|nr:MAG: homoserine dehydrogenase [Acidobacteriota bacterium]